ncbi:MAG TPA: hypothetical protein VJ919_13475 [Tangfeifania sp.]|nr:hypothetical protein [Tangfeifania sp.]
MEIKNKKRVMVLRRLFFLVSLVIALVALALFLKDYTLYAIGTVGVFALWFLFFQVADYQYIEFSNENNKILLRYYKAVRFGKTDFHAIEFSQNLLHNAVFANSMFGKMTDLTLIIRTRRGIAEYPSVSLTALSPGERKSMQATLHKIIGV